MNSAGLVRCLDRDKLLFRPKAKLRFRNFLRAADPGIACSDSGVETQECNTKSCFSSCVTTEWSEWSSCPVSCGKGERFRLRHLLVPPVGDGVCDELDEGLSEFGDCPIPPCETDTLTNNGLLYLSLGTFVGSILISACISKAMIGKGDVAPGEVVDEYSDPAAAQGYGQQGYQQQGYQQQGAGAYGQQQYGQRHR